METTWVMVRENFRWLEVDFRDFVEKRGIPVKRLSRAKMEAVFEDGVRLLGVTDDQNKQERLLGLNIAKWI